MYGIREVESYPGWYYFKHDENTYSYVSPSGRLVDKPGGKFHGQLSKEEFEKLKRDFSESQWFKNEEALEDSFNKKLQQREGFAANLGKVSAGTITATKIKENAISMSDIATQMGLAIQSKHQALENLRSKENMTITQKRAKIGNNTHVVINIIKL